MSDELRDELVSDDVVEEEVLDDDVQETEEVEEEVQSEQPPQQEGTPDKVLQKLQQKLAASEQRYERVERALQELQNRQTPVEQPKQQPEPDDPLSKYMSAKPDDIDPYDAVPTLAKTQRQLQEELKRDLDSIRKENVQWQQRVYQMEREREKSAFESDPNNEGISYDDLMSEASAEYANIYGSNQFDPQSFSQVAKNVLLSKRIERLASQKTEIKTEPDKSTKGTSIRSKKTMPASDEKDLDALADELIFQE